MKRCLAVVIVVVLFAAGSPLFANGAKEKGVGETSAGAPGEPQYGGTLNVLLGNYQSNLQVRTWLMAATSKPNIFSPYRSSRSSVTLRLSGPEAQASTNSNWPASSRVYVEGHHTGKLGGHS